MYRMSSCWEDIHDDGTNQGTGNKIAASSSDLELSPDLGNTQGLEPFLWDLHMYIEHR